MENFNRHGLRLRLAVLQMAIVLLAGVQNNFVGNCKGGRCSSTTGVQAAPLVPAFIILGDSTVDVGVNNHVETIVKCNWPPYGLDFPGKQATGRFCDGKLTIDFLAERLGLPYPLPYLDPNAEGPAILTGVNTASSGSGFLDLTAQQLSVVTLTQQISWLKEWQGKVIAQVGDAAAAQIFSEAIFAISTGSNDWINNYYANPPLQASYNYDKEKYRNSLLSIVHDRIQDLYNLGARRIALLSLPPLGCVPAEILLWNGSGRCIDFMIEDSLLFNVGLQNVINAFNGPGATVIYLDSYTLIYDAFHNPGKYGIVQTDTASVCCTLFTLPSFGPLCQQFAKTCAQPNDYLFWDAFHPSEFFNAQIADAFYNTAGPKFGLI